MEPFDRELAPRRWCLVCVSYTMSIIGAAVRRNLVVGVVAVAGGYLGGMLHDLTVAKPTTIGAERFEVVERSGHLVSYWGPDADRNIPAATSRGTLLAFLDRRGVRRVQLGTNGGDYSPHLTFYGADGPRDTPERYIAQPRLDIRLGWTGSPTLAMRGGDGDRVLLGARYGDVFGERELGWGLSFTAFKVPATAAIGYGRWWDGSYQSGITVANGTDKRWAVAVGERLRKPISLMKPPNR